MTENYLPEKEGGGGGGGNTLNVKRLSRARQIAMLPIKDMKIVLGAIVLRQTEERYYRLEIKSKVTF